MFFSPALKRLRLIAQRKRATIWLVRYQNNFTVLKQYGEDATETYEREVKNVKRIREAGFTRMPVMHEHDDTHRAILYEYFPHGDVWKNLLSRHGEEREQLIISLLNTMEYEATALHDPALRELSSVGCDPYVCIRRLVQKAINGDKRFSPLIALAREIDDLPGPFLCTRYDPELTNYLCADNGQVYACDMAGLRCCHALYLPTYALIHIILAWQRTHDAEARIILGRFTQKARARFVNNRATRRLWFLNLAEIFAYFVDWGLKRASINPWHLHGLFATTKSFLKR